MYSFVELERFRDIKLNDRQLIHEARAENIQMNAAGRKYTVNCEIIRTFARRAAIVCVVH